MFHTSLLNTLGLKYHFLKKSCHEYFYLHKSKNSYTFALKINLVDINLFSEKMKKSIILLLLLHIVIWLSSCSSQKQEIEMTKSGGVYTIPCELNGIPMDFIYDTGASYVSISSTEAEFLYKQGLLEDSNFRGISYTQIANGDIIPNAIVILDSIKIGSLALYAVEARVIYNNQAPLLLGQSALERLGRIEWEGNKLYISVEKENKGIRDNIISFFDSIKYFASILVEFLIMMHEAPLCIKLWIYGTIIFGLLCVVVKYKREKKYDINYKLNWNDFWYSFSIPANFFFGIGFVIVMIYLLVFY